LIVPPRHLIIGGGTAGINAIRTIREEEETPSEITLVSAERPYSRMVLPYYLDRSIAESRVLTATAALLAQWNVKPYVGRRAAALDTRANICTLDDGTRIEYDDCLIATGSRAVRAPVPGADRRGVHAFWTLDEARGVIAQVQPGSHVVMIGAGFIAFTILNSILALGAKLTIVEIAPRILPRMIDGTGAELVEAWLRQHGVAIRTDAAVVRIEDAGKPAVAGVARKPAVAGVARKPAVAGVANDRARLVFERGAALVADVVIMATGIKTNLEWLEGSGIHVNHGIVVDDQLRSNVGNVYAAGDVAEGRDLISGEPSVHAIEPTAQEHGRVVGANMAGKATTYSGSLLMNIVEVCHLDIASFGAWDDARAEVATAIRPERPAYRKLCWTGDRLTGAIILGVSSDIWTTNDIGMLKGLVQTGASLTDWKEHLRKDPFDVKPAFMASQTTARLLPRTVLGRPSVPPGNTPVAV
jgi:NAD(P)H-nitrite reductase large subunit